MGYDSHCFETRDCIWRLYEAEALDYWMETEQVNPKNDCVLVRRALVYYDWMDSHVTRHRVDSNAIYRHAEDRERLYIILLVFYSTAKSKRVVPQNTFREMYLLNKQS